MKKNLILIFALIALFSLNGSVSAQKKRKAAPPPPKTKPQLDPPRDISGGSTAQTDFFGFIEANTYKNKFFDVKITAPEKWLVQESDVNKAIKEAGAESTRNRINLDSKTLEAAMQRVNVLFTTTKDILGMENNSIMSFVVEKSPALTQFRNGEDYLRLNLQTFKRFPPPADFKYSTTIKPEKLGTETFYYMDIERTGYKQKIYATARKGYALFFILSYFSDEDMETMKEIIRNSDFAWKE